MGIQSDFTGATLTDVDICHLIYECNVERLDAV